ncbi:MAG: hypothetical protein JRI23_10635 [Deltaproteobacteria bacterium]|jgi:hypothetical protein|nr:hypothetical protein [Deltaproteobacteria bacterium]MBW2532133.1 hypothetical protein [Deltaproteobacteria bacterium]
MQHLRQAIIAASLLGAVATTLGACVGAGPETGSSVDDVTAAPGFYAYLEEGESFPIVDVAATESVAYLARMHRGVQTVDLATMQLGERWSHDDRGDQLVVDGLQVVGESLVVWGQRNDPDWWDQQYSRPFVIKGLALDRPEVLWTVELELAPAIDSGQSIIQLPSTNAFVDGATSTLWVSFGHIDRPDRIVTFPLPAEAHASYDFTAIAGATELAANNPKAVVVAPEGTAYVAAGGSGLFAIAPDGREPELVAAELGYTLDLRVDGSIAYVADHDGALHRVDVTTGELLSTEPVDDWVEGVEVTADNVLVATRTGLLVTSPAPR